MANQGRQQTVRSPWGARLGLVVIGVVLSLAVVVYSTFFFGLIQGEEFSPETFERRHFAYYEIPLVGFQVSPITHSDQTGDLEEFLVAKQIVPVKKGGNPRWDLVSASRGNVLASPGDAKVLCDYFDTVDADKKTVWLRWTEEHTELGILLWPAVADLAEQELYVFIPDLLELARQTTAADEFQSKLDQMLTVKYTDLAQTQQSLGRHEQAVELYSHALVRAPQDINALQGRAQSLKSLGKTREATTDLDLVRKIQRE